MNKIKKEHFIELLNSCTQHQLKKFRYYLKSDYLCGDSNVIKLFNRIQKGLKSGKVQQSAMSKSEKKYHYPNLQNKFSSFLALELTNEHHLTCSINQLKALSFFNHSSLYDRQYNQLHKVYSSIKTIKDQYQLHQLHLIHFDIKAKEGNIKMLPNFSDVVNSFDLHFLLERLRLTCAYLNLKKVVNTGPIEITAAYIIQQAQHFHSHPLMQVYLSIYHMLIEENAVSHYKLLTSRLAETISKQPINEQQDIFQHLKNFCIRKINSGDETYVAELFNLYKEILQNKQLVRSGIINQWEYKNITAIGLRLAEFQFIKSFIKKYNKLLPTEQQLNALCFNEALCHFHEKKYHQCIKKLSAVAMSDLFYALDVRSLQLRSYYLLDEDDMFYYHADAFKAFLNRHKKMSLHQKSNYKNFIKIMVHLRKAGHHHATLIPLRNQIESSVALPNKRWLLETIDEVLQIN